MNSWEMDAHLKKLIAENRGKSVRAKASSGTKCQTLQLQLWAFLLRGVWIGMSSSAYLLWLFAGHFTCIRELVCYDVCGLGSHHQLTYSGYLLCRVIISVKDISELPSEDMTCVSVCQLMNYESGRLNMPNVAS